MNVTESQGAPGEEQEQEIPLTEEEKRERKLDQGIGLPHAYLEVVQKDATILEKVLCCIIRLVILFNYKIIKF